MTKLSIIIPAYNEERNIFPLYKRVASVLKEVVDDYELIFVDDGSRDGTYSEIRRLHQKDKRVKLIRFRRNFQKAAALMAGFEHASGEFIITIDADLQDEPQEIPRFLEAIRRKNLDVVVGWKYYRKDPWHKRVPSKIFNIFVRKLTKIKIHDSDCNFRIMRKEVIETLNLYGGLYRYIPSLAQSRGFKVGEIKVKHNKRKFGKSKYGFGRFITGALDLITIKFLIDYKKRPLHLFGFIGGLFSLLGVCLISYLIIIRLGGEFIGHRPLLQFSILSIIIGIQFLFFGLLAEMIQSSSKKKSTEELIREKLL